MKTSIKILLLILLLFTINVKAETITISSKTTLENKEIEDNREQSNVLIVSGSELKLNSCKITKKGDGTDNLSDTPNNVAILIKDNSKVNIEKIEVNTEGSFSHGMYFMKSDGNITDSSINTNNKFATGIIVDGGKVIIDKTKIETKDHDSSGLYVITGEVEIKNSSITTNSVDSPLLKSASKVTISDSKLTGNKAEGIIGISGSNITLYNTSLETNNISALSSNFNSVLLYNPLEKEEKTYFKAVDSNIKTIVGDTFIVVNSDVEITLENTKVENTNGIFLRTFKEELVEESKNNIKINLVKEDIKGDISLDSDSKLDIYLDKSNYIGAINPNSSSKDVNVTLTKDSSIKLTGNMYVKSLTNGDYENTNIDLNGYKLYINGEELSKDNIKHLDEKNDNIYIIFGLIIGCVLGFSVVYLIMRSKKVK